MGVEVLPPDLNSSGWDFQIEEIDGRPHVRFGLGAIKNLGKAAVEVVIQERDRNGRFRDLNDFAQRVDLRALGKRGLECLIKVGALDAFGKRVALLAALDRIVAISSNHARAAEAGQLSLFGAATGVEETLTLPDVQDVDRREMLNWERELIGLYISDHPLTPYQQTFARIVTHFSGQLPDAQNEEKVRVAGLVTNVRPYVTKTGKPMGFATLEDIQGNIDLVLFPRTWEKTREQLSVGQILIVEGKADTTSTPPKVLVDTVRTEFKMTISADEDLGEPVGVPVADSVFVPASSAPAPADQKANVAERSPVYAAPAPARGPVGVQAAPDDDWDIAGMPPPPDNFPADWETEWQPSFENAELASRPEPKPDNRPVAWPPMPAPEDRQPEPRADQPAPVAKPAAEPKPAPAAPHQAAPRPVTPPAQVHPPLPSLYVPLARAERDKEHPPRQITLTLRSMGDKDRDKLRIKTLYGTLISFHGIDRFSFQIFEAGKGHLIDFPNDTTRICPELLARLQRLVGEENLHVEDITFQ